MAFSTYTQSFGASYANAEVSIRRTDTGAPAVIMSSSTGGVVNDQGRATCDASGNLSVIIDTAYTYQFFLNDKTPTTQDGVKVIQDAALGMQLATTGGQSLTGWSGVGAVPMFATPTQQAGIQALVSGAGNPSVGGALRMFGHSSNSAGAGYTFLLEAQALAPFYGYQGIYINYGTSQTISAAKTALTPTALNNGTGLTWGAVTFGGASSGSQSAGSGSGQNVIPSILVSDRIIAPSLARTDYPGRNPMVQFRSYFAGASTQQSVNANAMGDVYAATGLEYATNLTNADAVTTISSLVPAANNTWMCPVGVVFDYGVPTRTVADVGDSLMRGQESSTASNGWYTVTARACATKRITNFIWQPASFAITGQTSSASYSTGLEVVSQLKPSHLCFRAWSPNDGSPTQALMDAAWGRTLSLIEHCRRNNVIPVLCTTGPRNSYSAGEDALLKAQNLRVKALTGWCIVSDEAAVIEDPANRSQILAAFNSGDGLHYTSSCYDAMATVRSAALIR